MSGNSLPRLGDYLLIERVGEGGMAEVFRAQYSGEDHSVGPQSVVVVKRIKPELFNKPEFPIFREMFLNEAKLVRSLQHPNLARVYALLEAVDPELGQKVPFIVQEYVQGQQLWELLRIATRGFTGLGVPPGVAAFISREMSRGLGHAHTHKDAVTGRLTPIIHRDISPENVMVSAEGNVKVIDFGVAKALGGFGPQTRTGIIKGKLAYMAPEQVAQKVVPATDVFGAAIVLHEMLTGRRLFGGHNDFMVITRVLKAEIPRPSQLQKGIPKELDDVVMTALSRDLKVRYLDGDAFAEALTRVMAKLPEMRGVTALTIKQWSKQVIAEGVKISSNWDEEESGVHVEVDVTGAMRRVEASSDDIIELTADDLMRSELEGSFDPGVRAAVTQGLMTLRPDMIASRNSLPPVSSADGASSAAGAMASLPGIGRAPATKPVPAPEPAPAAAPVNSSSPVRQTPPPNIGTPPVRQTPPPNVGNPLVRQTPPPNLGNPVISLTPPVGLETVPPPAGEPSAPEVNRKPSSNIKRLASTPMPIISAAGSGNPSESSNPSGIGKQVAGSDPHPWGVREDARHGPTQQNIDAMNAALAELGVDVPASGPAAPLPQPGPPSPAKGVGALPVAVKSPPAGVKPALADQQIEQWAKFIFALLALSLVLAVLLLLRE